MLKAPKGKGLVIGQPKPTTFPRLGPRVFGGPYHGTGDLDHKRRAGSLAFHHTQVLDTA